MTNMYAIFIHEADSTVQHKQVKNKNKTWNIHNVFTDAITLESDTVGI
jgi:hypothetical protein